MATLAHGGRIVPILTGHDQQLDSSSSVNLLENNALPPRFPSSLLLDQHVDSSPTRHPKAMDHASLEMPCLKEHGLFALPTEGDGNCLYYSLSDQLYADTHHADQIRELLANHMANNKQYFMQFVVAEGGERRRPKRAAASAYATRSADVSAPSEEDKERRFEDMVAATRKNGEWGSSEHLQAFCQVFRVDIRVYTLDGIQVFRDVNASPHEVRDVIHVAFHDFKHYSSVRVVGGSHTGLFAKSKCAEHLNLPIKNFKHSNDYVAREIKDEVATTPPHLSNGFPADSKEAPFSTDTTPTNNYSPVGPKKAPLSTDHPSFTTNGNVPVHDSGLAVDVFPPWDIQSIQDGLGGRYDRDTIVDMLQKCRGDIDRAFTALLGEKNDGTAEKKLGPGPNIKPSLQVSRSSSPFSTGSKRSAEDSDDSDEPRPPTRRVRPKHRIVSNLTLGVGISFCDDQNEVVSLNLRMKADAEKANAEKAAAESTPVEPVAEAAEHRDPAAKKGPRRSGRLSRTRELSPGP